MNILKFTLAICGFAGCWQPPLWTSLSKNIMYKAYATFLMSSLYIFLISQIVYIVLNINSSDKITDTIYIMLTILVAGYKQVYMWIDRKSFMTIINMLTEKSFAPRESRELAIQRKFENAIQQVSVRVVDMNFAEIAQSVDLSCECIRVHFVGPTRCNI